MADESSDSNERTQDPTPRRLEEALRRGDVVKSMEVNTWFTIAGGTLAMMIFAVPSALCACPIRVRFDGSNVRYDCRSA